MQRLLNVGRWFSYYLRGLYDRLDRHHAFLLASGLSFSLIFCIIPLMLIVFSLLGHFLQQPDITEHIDVFISRAIPYPEQAAYAKDLVFTRVAEFAGYKKVAGAIGMIGLFFAASGLFSAMRTALNTIFRVRTSESVLIGKMRDFGLIALVMVYFLASTTILPALDVISGYAHKIDALNPLRFGSLETLAVEGISFGLVFLTFFVIYALVPQKRQPKRAILVSALAAAILWYVAKQIFGYYISHFVTLKRVYGAYTLIVAMALWIYYSSMVFIIGAEIGQLSRERRDKQERDRLPPSAFFAQS